MDIYIVKPGDTLYGIARRTGTTADHLAYLNQLNDPSRLVPNMALLVPGPEQPNRQEILVNAYAYPGISDATLNETLPYLSFLCPFSNRLTLDGELVTIDDGRLVEAALAQNVAPFLTVTNLSESGGFSSDIAHAVFTDQAVQDAAIENIFAALSRRRYAGVNLNIEYVYPFDRESYNQFLRRLSGLLHERGWYLTTAIAPKESADQEGLLYTAHDYAAHGRWADWVVLMTYEWGYTYGPPMAVAPKSTLWAASCWVCPTTATAGACPGGRETRPWSSPTPPRRTSPSPSARSFAMTAPPRPPGSPIPMPPVSAAPSGTRTSAACKRVSIW